MKVFSDLSICYRLRQNQRGVSSKEKTVYCRIIFKGKRFDISTKQNVNPIQWDKVAGRLKQKALNSKYLNTYLESLSEKIIDVYLDNRNKNNEDVIGNIKQLVFGGNKLVYIKKSNEPIQLLCDLLKRYREDLTLKSAAGVYAIGTFTGYKCSLLSFENYLKKYYITNSLSLNDTDREFFFKFETYLLTEKLMNKNSAYKVLKHTRRIFNFAYDNGWIDKRIEIKFGVKYTNPPRQVLNMNEIMDIYSLNLECKILQEARDIFVFACFTGLGFSELKTLNSSNYRTLNGRVWIVINRKKTGSEQKMVLLPVAQKIIEKYKSTEYCIKRNQLLPVRSNAGYNRNLKEIQKLAGINTLLTSHLARHNFATTIALANNMPIETLSKVLGHTSLRTTQIYAKILDSKICSDFDALDKALSFMQINNC